MMRTYKYYIIDRFSRFPLWEGQVKAPMKFIAKIIIKRCLEFDDTYIIKIKRK